MGRPSNKTIIKAITNSGGVMSTIASRLSCTWYTAQSWVNASPETLRAYKDEEEKILDTADIGLYKEVQNGNLQAIKWIQATKGKRRGYVERVETTGANGQPLESNIKIVVKSPIKKSNGKSN
jgi:hypothetical protein